MNLSNLENVGADLGAYVKFTAPKADTYFEKAPNMPLKDTEIRALKSTDKNFKVADGGGLYVEVTPSGSKLWKLKFRIHGKEKKLSLGKYPEVSLKDARAARDKAKLQIHSGIDPAQKKREAKQQAKLGAENSFKMIGAEFIEKMEKEGLAPATLSKASWLFRQLCSSLGTRPICDIKPTELLASLKKVEADNKRETARRMRSLAGRIFRYAIATGRADNDPTYSLKGALLTPQVKHLPAITDPKKLGELLRAIDGYSGRPVTMIALRLTPHLFQRPGEIRKMEWNEVNFEKAIWTIPTIKMKQRQPHHVPLSNQSLAMLKEIMELRMSDKFVFSALGKPQKPMSENAVVGALRRLDYSGNEMSAHGFRTTASSLLNESGKWNPDAIERALSHVDRNEIRRTYNRTEYWDERVKMAQWWSDYLDKLKNPILSADSSP